MINYKVSKCKNPGKNAVEGTTFDFYVRTRLFFGFRF